MLLFPTRMYCRAFIWPFIQSPGIYYPISVLVKTSQRNDRQTVALFEKSGRSRRRKRLSKHEVQFSFMFFAPLSKQNIWMKLWFLLFLQCASLSKTIYSTPYDSHSCPTTRQQTNVRRCINLRAAFDDFNIMVLAGLAASGGGQPVTFVRWIEVERNAKVDRRSGIFFSRR